MTDASHQDCGPCPLAAGGAAIARRRFLQLTGLAVAPLLLTALDVRPARALSSAREEKRYPLPAADGVSVDRDNGVMIARASGKVYAFSLACPHQNTALRWEADAHEFRCPKHKSHYRADGTFIEGRATRPMDRLALRRESNVLVVEVDTMYRQDEHPAEWANASIAVA